MPDDVVDWFLKPPGSLLLFLAVGILTGWIADRKGHSSRKWFAGGLLLPIVALPWVILMPRDRAELEARDVKAGRIKRCPRCAELVRPEAKACKHCGAELTSDGVATT